MLKKKNRLTIKEFEKIFKKGKNIHSDIFFLKILKLNSKKVSVSISKKIEKRAVGRIKSRRLIYKILRDNFDKIPNGLNIIWVIKKNILEKERDKIKKEVLFLIKKINKIF